MTGPQKDLYDLSVGGFKLAAMEVPAGEHAPGGDGPFLHSSKFVLVDGEGVIRGYYDSTDEQAMRALVADARRRPGRAVDRHRPPGPQRLPQRDQRRCSWPRATCSSAAATASPTSA